MRDRMKLDRKNVRVMLAVGFSLTVLVGLGLIAGVGVSNLNSVAAAYEYSTTITTSTTTTTTPTTTKPGKGCGDKNHLHDRRFECKITISDVSKKEGNSGLTAFVFTVSAPGSPMRTTSVDWATAGGTASPAPGHEVGKGASRERPDH